MLCLLWHAPTAEALCRKHTDDSKISSTSVAGSIGIMAPTNEQRKLCIADLGGKVRADLLVLKEEESGVDDTRAKSHQTATQQQSEQRSRPRSAKPASLHQHAAEGHSASEQEQRLAGKDADALKENAQPTQAGRYPLGTEDGQLDAFSLDTHPPSRHRGTDQELNDLLIGANAGEPHHPESLRQTCTAIGPNCASK